MIARRLQSAFLLRYVLLAAVSLSLGSGAAFADVTISKAPTRNMSCSGGVCAPVAANAVLNASDLAAMLASGDVKVTTGSGATNIVVKDSFGWASTSHLTLDAVQSVEIGKPVMVTGTGAMTLTTNDGGSGGDLMFDGKGAVTFWDLSSSLIVNGNSYTLVNTIATLASDITANPSGFYALANDYDASVDGTYASIPVGTELFGTFEGLGHVISNLTIHSPDSSVGLFEEVQGTLRDIGLTKASISTNVDKGVAGTLLAVSSQATIVGCFASGTLTSGSDVITGGLVGSSRFGDDGTIVRSHSSVDVSGGDGSAVGGLVGSSGFAISLSYATGKVSGGSGTYAGGLIGVGGNNITQSYASGTVTGGANAIVGGLIGSGGGPMQNTYANGPVKGGDNSYTGAFAGQTGSIDLIASYSAGHVHGNPESQTGGILGHSLGNDRFADAYWDTDTTGQSRKQGCAGHRCGGGGGTKGLKTETLQSGLPSGFDSSVWGENANINGGLPYLLALPPK